VPDANSLLCEIALIEIVDAHRQYRQLDEQAHSERGYRQPWVA
jgi:hypothetical protein